MSPCPSTAAQGTRGSPVRCRLANASSQCMQPGGRHRRHRPDNKPGCERGCRRFPSGIARRAERRPRIPSSHRLIGTHLCDLTLQPALGARMTGRCAWRWWTARGATRPRSQLPRRRLQLAMVRAGAPSSTTPLPTPNPPPATLLVAPAPARLPAVHRFAGWAGGLMAQRGAARRAVWRLFKLCTHLECHRASRVAR